MTVLLNTLVFHLVSIFLKKDGRLKQAILLMKKSTAVFGYSLIIAAIPFTLILMLTTPSNDVIKTMTSQQRSNCIAYLNFSGQKYINNNWVLVQASEFKASDAPRIVSEKQPVGAISIQDLRE